MRQKTSAAAPSIALLAALALACGAGHAPADAPANAPANALADGALYRWLEPDGSRTFSTTPPTDGRAYTAVDPDTLRPVDGDAAPSPRLASATLPRTEPVRTPLAAEPATRPQERARAAPTRSASLVGRTEESKRCTELRKRVVSLERRLTVPLTAEEMDETVVRMAGYQRSLEALCL